MSSKENASNRKGMATAFSIYQYWKNAFIEMDDVEGYVVVDPNGPHGKRCFACGSPKKVQRAHIRALCEGGGNGPENLHLLCGACHIDSEMLSGKGYWRWFRFELKKDGWMASGIKTLVAMNPELTTPEATQEWNNLSSGQRKDLCYKIFSAVPFWEALSEVKMHS